MTTVTLALIIFAAILAQVAVVMLFGLYRRKRQYRDLNVPVSTDDVDTLNRASAEPTGSVPAWQGFREFVVQAREMEDGNNAVCSFYLVPADGKPLPSFRPGQFLTFKLQIEDPNTHELKSVMRCYSLSDAPRPEHYRITIKRIPAPIDQPDVPAGVSSSFFHDQVQVGSRLLVKAPSGHFHLMEAEPLPIVLIGGGIGITPMLSMLNTVLESGINREIWLFYGVRNGSEQIMTTQLQVLARTHSNFHLNICYSAANEQDVEGVNFQHHGWVSMSLLRSILTLQRYQFYVCGPRPVMESLIPGLEDWGVVSADIYYESFGPATLIKREQAAPTTTAAPITVTFSRSGKSLLWDGAVDSLLEFAEANDIEIESGCRAGSCGTCQTVLKSGEVDYNQEPDIDVEPGHCLLCISTPKCDLTLDA